ncbi:uncharacterized protein [Chlorocebus sabaeus]|uniref:uncharacterized protein isoform X3 n=1 Tax=Chlorocebus sabaeus TaxID=60711 RepID=UPI003BF9FC16
MASGSCSPGRALASPDPGIDMDEHAIRLTHHPTSSSALMTFASTPLKPPQDTVSHGQDGAFQSCSDGALRPNPALQGAGAETHSRTPSTPDSQHKENSSKDSLPLRAKEAVLLSTCNVF